MFALFYWPLDILLTLAGLLALLGSWKIGGLALLADDGCRQGCPAALVFGLVLLSGILLR
jgi:hypothetical protein